MSRIAVSLLALLVATGCSGRDATGPTSSPTAPLTPANITAQRAQTEKHGRLVEVTYTKWFPSLDLTSLLMTGFTGGDVVGTFAGEVLVRTPLPTGIVQLTARYEVIAQRRGHSFTAIIQGEQDATGHAVLDGVVTAGWMIGQPVHVVFQRFAPCVYATRPAPANSCFQGSISITRGHRGGQDDGRDDDDREDDRD
jgi:hypothetical protein